MISKRGNTSFRTVAATGISLVAAMGLIATSASGSVAQVKKSTTSVFTSKECKGNKSAGTINYISPFGYNASAGIADIFMAQKLGYFKKMCLTVNINASAQDAPVLVSADSAQASSASTAGDVMGYIATGSNIIGVETVANLNPAAIVMNSKFTNLKQLQGGTLGYHGVISDATLSMLGAAGVDISQVQFEDLTTRNPTVVTQGTVDAIAASAGNEPFTLKAQGLPFTEVTPKQLGVAGTSNVMFMNKKFVSQHPGAAEDFIRADLKALDYCTTHPTPCVQYVSSLAAQANESTLFSLPVNTQSWNFQIQSDKSAPTKPLGLSTVSAWRPEYQALIKYGPVAYKVEGITGALVVPSLNKMFDPTLVQNVYNTKGQLIWP